ncbi:MAG: heavy-metal-associated domain-containing protein [Candidatus Heimdallarchaeaceae archaeon]
MDEILLKVEGMTCQHCVMTVTKALQSIDGVVKANVDLKEGLAMVKYDPSKTNTEAMINVVVDNGYSAKAV